jgi:hypothetical protein
MAVPFIGTAFFYVRLAWAAKNKTIQLSAMMNMQKYLF